MKSLYKRIVTVGMVSITALLAWIYCIASFSKQPLYIAGVSIVLVISVYALLNALTGLHIEKEKTLLTYITQTADTLVSRTLEANQSDEAERLAKATYVQLRKSNTMLANLSENLNANNEQSIMVSNEHHDDMTRMLSETVNKAAKIVVKYNETNTTKLVNSIETMTQLLEELKGLVNNTKNASDDAIDYTNILDNINYQILELKTAIENGQAIIPPTQSVPVEKNNHTETEADAEAKANAETKANSEEAAASATDTMFMNGLLDQATIDALIAGDSSDSETEPATEVATEPEPVVAEDPNKKLSDDEIAALFAAAPSKEPEVAEVATEPEPVVAEDPNKKLSDDEIAALFAAAAPSKEPEVAEVATEPEPVVAEDPNKKLSDDEIAALFAAAAPSKEPEVATEPEPVVAEDPNKKLSDDEIAALFAAAAPSKEPEPKLADVIPFPSANTKEESTVIDSTNNDPNRQLSADEIAALFAAAAPVSEPESEPEPVVAEDPNKKLSDDEIAALFAAAAPSKEPELVKEPVVSEDSNKKLSDDEIAALFAAAAPSKEPEVAAEPEPAKEPEATPLPVDDNPNRQLSPDEIAALFASMGS